MQSAQKPHVGFPYEIKKINEKDQKRVAKDFSGQAHPLVRVGREKWILPESFCEYASQIYNFKARPDDVFICTHPRSGAAMTQEMVWLLCNDLDFKTAQNVALVKRVPFFE